VSRQAGVDNCLTGLRNNSVIQSLAGEGVGPAVAEIEVLVGVVQVDVVAVEAEGLAKARSAGLATNTVRVRAGCESNDGGERSGAGREEQDRTHGLITSRTPLSFSWVHWAHREGGRIRGGKS
jgi:hypothetical protein